MILSAEARHAITQMRYFQQLEETHRVAVKDQYQKVRQQQRDAYQRTNRETFGALEETITQIANADPIRKSLVGDEQFARSLAEMYAQIAAVEISLCEVEAGTELEKSSRSLRNADTPRVK
jgi:uncharacterized membrane-anchored protein YjiN (DUF445 family)